VFEYGDEGQLFYIVMEGEVEVRIPLQVVLEGEDATPVGFYNYLVKNFNDIHWPQIADGRRMQLLLLREMEMFNIKISSKNKIIDTKQAVERMTKALMKEKTNIHKTLYYTVCPTKEPRISVSAFRQVTLLGEGKGFGELALIKPQGRAATIVCTKLSRFATLHRKDYILNVGNEQKQKTREKIAMLRQFRIFSKKNVKDSQM